MVKLITSPFDASEPYEFYDWKNFQGSTTEFSDKSLIPAPHNPASFRVYPIRYAVGDETLRDVVTPELSRPFDAGNIPLGDKTHYTLRRMRQGFLYVYDEARDHWEGFQILKHGSLLKLDDFLLPEGPEGKPKPLPPESKVPAFFEVPYAEEATKVWLAFSDAKWTQAVFDKFKDASYREKHMRMLDVAVALGKEECPHAIEMEMASQRVTEYQRKMSRENNPFWFSEDPFGWAPPYAPKDEQVTSVALALDDPAGILMDLATLMLGRFGNWAMEFPRLWDRRMKMAGEAPYLWALSTYNNIKTAKDVLADRFKTASIQRHIGAGNGDYFRAYPSPSEFDPKDPRYHDMEPANHRFDRPNMPWSAKSINAAIKADEGRVKEQLQSTWEDVTEHLDRSRFSSWESRKEGQENTFNETQIKPLIQAYLGWLHDRKTAQYFETLDEKDFRHNLIFTEVVTRCFKGVQDKIEIQAEMVKQLDDPNSLLSNASMLNNSDIKAALSKLKDETEAEAVTPENEALLARTSPPAVGPTDAIEMAATVKEKGTDPLAKAWEVLYAEAPKQLGGEKPVQQVQHALARFVGTVGSAAAISYKNIPAKRLNPVLRNFRAYCYTRTAVFHLSGSPLEVMEKMYQLRYKFLSPTTSDTNIRAAAELECFKLGIPDMAADQRIAMEVEVSVGELIHTPGAMTGIKKEGINKRFKTLSVGEVFTPPKEMERPTTGTVLPAVLQTMFQYFALQKMSTDVENAMAFEKTDLQARSAAQLLTVAGSVADLVGKGLTKSALFRALPNATPELAGARLWIGGGQALGLFAGLTVAVMDGLKAWSALKDGRGGLACMYFASSTFGAMLVVSAAVEVLIGVQLLGASWSFLIISGPWTWILTIGGIGLSAVISKWTENDKLRNWMDRCCFGKHETFKPFSRPEDENREFLLAMELPRPAEYISSSDQVRTEELRRQKEREYNNMSQETRQWYDETIKEMKLDAKREELIRKKMLNRP